MDHVRAAGLPGVPGLRTLDLGPEGTFRLPLLHAAKSILDAGGLVHSAGDAYGGTGGVLLPFRGRLRRFAEGFAALAVLADVPVLPVFARLDPRGRIVVEILPPLPDDAPRRDRRARIVALVAAYGRVLEARWAQTPGDIPTTQLRAFVSLPVIDAPGPGAPTAAPAGAAVGPAGGPGSPSRC
jgi:hypothetical protein